MQEIGHVKKVLAEPKNIVLTSHRNPDGDAIGSSLAMKLYLSKLGHHVHVMFPSEFPTIFSWMPGVDEILICDLNEEECKKHMKLADVIFSLDYNSLDRVDTLGEMIYEMDGKAFSILIDHHLYPDNFADYSLTDTTASSTCELVYDFLLMLEDKDKIDRSVALCLLTGILTDTGSFNHSTTPKLFRTVADLLEFEVEYTMLQDLVFNNLELKHLKLLGHCLHNNLELHPDFNTAVISLTREDYKTFNIQRGDTEGIVNYMLKLKDVVMAVFIMEQPKIVKLSFRSKGDFSVQEIASRYFKGGGHKNAAGGASWQDLDTTKNRLLNILPKYKEQLNKTRLTNDAINLNV